MRAASSVLAIAVVSGLWVTRALAVSPSLGEVEQYTARSHAEQKHSAAQSLRDDIVRDAGLGIGVRAGFSERAQEIRARLDARQPELDRIFNFNPLLIDNRMLVPAIERVENVQAVKDGVLRESKQVYRIVDPARLVTAAPTWRDWLTLAPLKLQRPEDGVLPSSSEEKHVWKTAVDAGWAYGIKQADAVFQTQLEVLTQAYTGRLRYRRLRGEQMVTAAQMDRSDMGVVREDATLRVGDSLYSIAKPSQFVEAGKWRAVPRLSVPVITPAVPEKISPVQPAPGKTP